MLGHGSLLCSVFRVGIWLSSFAVVRRETSLTARSLKIFGWPEEGSIDPTHVLISVHLFSFFLSLSLSWLSLSPSWLSLSPSWLRGSIREFYLSRLGWPQRKSMKTTKSCPHSVHPTHDAHLITTKRTCQLGTKVKHRLNQYSIIFYTVL